MAGLIIYFLTIIIFDYKIVFEILVLVKIKYSMDKKKENNQHFSSFLLENFFLPSIFIRTSLSVIQKI